MTQEQQVIKALKELGGYTTLRKLYEHLAPNFSEWRTRTPQNTVNCIVQRSQEIIKIRPGLWALNDCHSQVLSQLGITNEDSNSDAQFDHGYYQGLLVEIGNFNGMTTYVPSQDKNRRFLDKRLHEIADTTVIPQFTHPELLKKAKTVDVIWFNDRNMPAYFYEVEHTTDIRNSLFKFYELQDFAAEFYIVAPSYKKNEFISKIQDSVFSSIKDRVKFKRYEDVASRHSALSQVQQTVW
ncbi:MAG: hypothetical protein K2L26_07605 [Duncaniella sp.]|nr:hypothetical protein [Duncaniella sp.]